MLGTSIVTQQEAGRNLAVGGWGGSGGKIIARGGGWDQAGDIDASGCCLGGLF